MTTSADGNLEPPENTVDVTQSDDGSSSAASGQANLSNVTQDNVNLGTTATVTQTHNAAGAGQNRSDITQGRNATNGDVTVDQTGGDNTSVYTAFTSNNNDADIDQTGTDNLANVQQDFQAAGALAVVNQNGTGGATNSVFIDQISTGYAPPPPDEFAVGAEAYATQNGSGNSATIAQTGFSQTDALSNYASSNQQGDNNLSAITQSGIDNTATVSQTGSGHDSDVLQSGDANTALVTQTASGNVSDVIQSGNGNSVTVTQN